MLLKDYDFQTKTKKHTNLYCERLNSVMQAMSGKQKEFETALRKLRGADANISKEMADIQVSTVFTFNNFVKTYLA